MELGLSSPKLPPRHAIRKRPSQQNLIPFHKLFGRALGVCLDILELAFNDDTRLMHTHKLAVVVIELTHLNTSLLVVGVLSLGTIIL